jgi:predicted Holliday junction resolvase-like endonuclease
MQLQNLFKPLAELSEEELKARLQEIRHNREVVRPAKKARERRESNKGRVSKINKAQSLLSGLSKEQIAQLLMEFGGNDG